MTQRELVRLREALAVKRALLSRSSPRPFLPQEPTPRQAEFLGLTCLEALYGGAAGGGKSSALLMAALQYVHVPGYAAILLRRTYADLALPGAIMDRSHDWLQGTGATWNQQDKRWTFPSGASLSFGYLETERDKYRYQGAELQFIGVDELTQWTEPAYRYLLSRLRRLAGVDVPLRARAASNPGGIGHDWVRRTFVESDSPERRFVPANLGDNPHLDQAEYRRSLARLDENTRRQLEEGLWVRDVGGLVYSGFNEERNLVEVAPKCDFHLLGMDYGNTAATSFNVLGWRANDPCVYVLESYKRNGMIPSAAGEEAHKLEARFKFVRMVGDVGGLGKGYSEEARARFTLPIESADKNNKLGYIALLNGDLERGRLKVVRSKCEALIDEWTELAWTDDRQKEAPGFPNHCADGTLYAWRAACAYHEREASPPPTAAEQARAEEAALVERAEQEAVREANGAWWET